MARIGSTSALENVCITVRCAGGGLPAIRFAKKQKNRRFGRPALTTIVKKKPPAIIVAAMNLCHMVE